MAVRRPVCILLDLQNLLGHFRALRGELATIDQHAALLHSGQHRNQRNFDISEHRSQLWILLQARPEVLMQEQCDVGIFRRVVAGSSMLTWLNRICLAPLPADFFVVGGLSAQVFQRQRVHVVAAAGAVEHVGFQHGVESDALDLDAIGRQHIHVVLHVLTDFRPLRVFQQWPESGQHLVAIQLFRRAGIVMTYRDVKCLCQL